jgi:DNA-binding transcriptional ArsR family regulator
MLEQSNIDGLLQALAVAPRRAMVERLGRGPASVSDLARPFDMTLAAVVQHLQVLEACGLVRSEKVGRVRTCTLQPQGLAPLEAWIAERRGQVERRLDRLGQFLDAQDAAMAEKPDGKDH